jgi:hypothetical protein
MTRRILAMTWRGQRSRFIRLAGVANTMRFATTMVPAVK